jgi:hypothetical protein
MKYMLIIYRDEAAFPDGHMSGGDSAACVAYTEALKQAGVLAGGDRLQSSHAASIIRVAGGETQILDGTGQGLPGQASAPFSRRTASSTVARGHPTFTRM